MNHRTFIWIAPLLLAPLTVRATAQQSLFQSASGDSAIYLRNTGGALSYNLASDAARFDMLWDRGNQSAFGGGVGGTVKNGGGAIINKSAPATGAFGEGGWMWRFKEENKDKIVTCIHEAQKQKPDGSVQPGQGDIKSCHESNAQLVMFQFHYGRTQFYNLSNSTPPVPAPTKLDFDEFRGTVAANFLRNYGWGDTRYGIAYVTGTSNNLADLTQDTYQAQVTTTTTTGESLLNPSSESVYVGAYKTHIAQEINADVVLQPNKLVNEFALDLMLRSDMGGGPGVRYASPGIGVYFFAKGKPVVPVCGLAYSYRAGNNQLAITAGWTFGGANQTEK